jgi:diguanylate cyclase (GGDEF)-like protein
VAGGEEFGVLTVTVASQMDLEGLDAAFRLEEVTKRLGALSTALAQVASRERLVARSLVDHLTKLPNRAAFEQYGERLISARGPDARPFGLLLFDLDGFKSINDDFGHQAGDQVLVAAAAAARSALRPEDMVSRLGGDEFGVLIPHCHRPQLEHAAERVREAISGPLTDLEAQTHASLGAYLIGEASVTWDQVFESADKAMYAAKADGGDQFVVA